MRTAYLDHPGPIAMAHRGFDDTGRGQENSLPAFEAAVRLGYRYVETDVHATRDGVVVAFHDETLDRVTDRRGAIPELSWREVSRARVGGAEPVPQLEDLLGSWPELRVNIDIKSPGAILPLVRVIERTRAHDRVCVTSFSDQRRDAAVMRLTRPVATSAGQRSTASFRAAAELPPLIRSTVVARSLGRVDGLQVPAEHRGIPVVTPTTVAAAHEVGRFVHVWTIDEPAEMHRLLDLGVDGIMTDRADVLREVLRQRGQWHD
ncbi:glycerophosphodiester phosphodiesterase [Ornithinimicrobium sp. CNJ-824]|uniref:glycerophosphodiester phosphodiesterase n=1 Tax=Ornithinimicrobium sp. CNJ-824 TaxID=1904966 RepID=UPI00095FF358|nr:glycerophosphodiester phosphodiesterase [Ornithinimicrobium sp. CNJ-824]OLT23691.1 glycerophosphodiester phosphodiesterase [Ornithinimicrobium sp. CNJ-824]